MAKGKAIACAAMRKLIHIPFGVLKSGLPFDPLYAI
jgi:transposase